MSRISNEKLGRFKDKLKFSTFKKYSILVQLTNFDVIFRFIANVSEAITVAIKWRFNDHLATLQLEVIHLLDGLGGRRDGFELDDAAASKLSGFIVEEFDPDNFSDFFAEQVFDFLPPEIWIC